MASLHAMRAGMLLRPASGVARGQAVSARLFPGPARPQRAPRAPLRPTAAAVTTPPILEAPALRRAAAAVVAPAVAATLAVAAAAAFNHWHLGALALRVIDPHVLGATAGACFKLGLVCTLVAWLVGTGQIPADAAPSLSKVGAADSAWRLC